MPKQKKLNPFIDVKNRNVESSQEEQAGRGRMLNDAKTLSVGEGTNVFRFDKDGLWMGAKTFADATFRVSMDGVVLIKADSGSGYVLIDGATQTITLNDGTDDRVKLDGANGRIRVSKAGEDVDVPGTDGVNLVMSSEYNSFKIISTLSGTPTITKPLAGSAYNGFEVTVAHNLSYVPVLAGGIFVGAPNAVYFPIGTHRFDKTTGDAVTAAVTFDNSFAIADSTNVYIRFYSIWTPTAATGTYKIYLLRETMT